MNTVSEFFGAAFPWVALGIFIALAMVWISTKEKKRETIKKGENENGKE